MNQISGIRITKQRKSEDQRGSERRYKLGLFCEHSLQERFADEGFGGGLELDQVREKLGGQRRFYG